MTKPIQFVVEYTWNPAELKHINKHFSPHKDRIEIGSDNESKLLIKVATDEDVLFFQALWSDYLVWEKC